MNETDLIDYINVPWMHYAQGEIGLCAVPGPGSHARIMQYYHDVLQGQLPSGSLGDHVPWCAAFVGSMLYRSGNAGSGSLLARSYLLWGEPSDPLFGSVAVLPRGKSWQGHVGFVHRVRDGSVQLLGGNQNSCVSLKWFPLNRALGFRAPNRVNVDA